MSVSGAGYTVKTGFHRQVTLHEPTNATKEVYADAEQLFRNHWNGMPIRRLGVNLSNFCSDRHVQLSLYSSEFLFDKEFSTIQMEIGDRKAKISRGV